MRTREVIGACALTTALAGCGLNVSSPDLFQITRTGPGRQLVLVVNDQGTVRCNGGAAKSLPNAALLQARALVSDVSKDAKSRLRIPPSRRSVFSYTMRTQDGTILFPDTAAIAHPELARVEQFAVRVARDSCGLPG